ncbi:MAG: hypothetical protein HFJ75_00530 [Eggerthellaceae bacterium]|nr:hypothetical protein [Eggerthellaceae bacterium]
MSKAAVLAERAAGLRFEDLPEDVVAKFRGLVSQTVSPERAQAIIDAVMTIDAAGSVSRLAELLVAERG